MEEYEFEKAAKETLAQSNCCWFEELSRFVGQEEKFYILQQHSDEG